MGTSATLDTGSTFKGTILADQSITMNTTSTLEGRALAFSGQVAFSGDGGSLPEALQFTDITTQPPHSVEVVISTTPHVLLTLQSRPAIFPASWTTIATSTPTASPWAFTNDTVTADVTTRFYRAFLTLP